MTTTETDVPTEAETPASAEPATAPEAPVLSLTIRRSNRLGTRILAVITLFAALGVTGYVVKTGLKPARKPPLEQATTAAWKAVGDLSDALRALDPGKPRTPAQGPARDAAAAVKSAQKRVEALSLPTNKTPQRATILRTLRADAKWIDAVGSTLANPRSARRGDLAGLAKTAASGTSLVAKDIASAKGSVAGTGRLLVVTKP